MALVDFKMLSIEGEEICVTGIDIVPRRPPVSIGDVDFFAFKARTSAVGKIEKQHTEMLDKPKYSHGASLATGSEITSDIISVFASDWDELGVGGAGRSHRHTGQFQIFKEVAFAVVHKSYPVNTIRNDPVKLIQEALRVVDETGI